MFAILASKMSNLAFIVASMVVNLLSRVVKQLSRVLLMLTSCVRICSRVFWMSPGVYSSVEH